MSGQIVLETPEGLPKQFVASLKILFDILDEEHTGLIRLRDIESRWSDEGVRDLPTGVVEGLRKVVPPNGLLSFECFVAGLKFALFQGKDYMKRRSMSAGGVGQKENRSPAGSAPLSARHFLSPTHPLQADPGNQQQGSPVPDTSKQGGGGGGSPHSQSHSPRHMQQKKPVDATTARPATAAVKPQPNNTTTSAGAYRRSNPPYPHGHTSVSSPRDDPPTHTNYPPNRQGTTPPRPDRSHHNPQVRKAASGTELQHPPQVPPRDQRHNQKVVNELKNWQRDWTASNGHGRGGRERPHPSNDPQHAIYANIDQFQRKQETAGAQQMLSPGKATVRRHGSGRRHTLQNGVDQNMIKRMQQLDEEGAMLRRGVEMVDVARDWYLRQLAALTDKQRMLGKVNYNDYSLEAHQERMNFERARITEVNLQLRTLVDSSEKGFPLHMNLAVTSTKGSANAHDAALKMVRDQNRRLLQDVTDKSDKISKLEQDKASLIRELFESRSKHKSNYDDTTFM